MGLKYSYNEKTDRWCADGLFFHREFLTREELEEAKEELLEEYFARRKSFSAFCFACAELR